MLTGSKITEAIAKKDIIISPFCEGQLGPNSYDLRLHNELLVYQDHHLDMKVENKTERITIPDTGLDLMPNRLYLARSIEWCQSDVYIPMLEGRSSIGRLGLFMHISSGFGNLGSSGYWTFELHCVQPIRIYPGVAVAQVYFVEPDGSKKICPGKNRYRGEKDITESMLWKELSEEGCF